MLWPSPGHSTDQVEDVFVADAPPAGMRQAAITLLPVLAVCPVDGLSLGAGPLSRRVLQLQNSTAPPTPVGGDPAGVVSVSPVALQTARRHRGLRRRAQQRPNSSGSKYLGEIRSGDAALRATLRAALPVPVGPREASASRTTNLRVPDARLTLPAPCGPRFGPQSTSDLVFSCLRPDRHLSDDASRGVRGDSGAGDQGPLTCVFAGVPGPWRVAPICLRLCMRSNVPRERRGS